MNKEMMIEKLLQKYNKYGISVEEITYMVEAGFDNDLEPDYIYSNCVSQLAEEHLN
ncbi:MAG: hypothetical protein IKW30_03030 [Lachnospiraceae bacterium]|nr:hypothetical protein [Lachnospiraceae bacterium]